MPELLLGCGNKREKLIASAGKTEWTQLVTLDNDPNCDAQIEWDLERLPLPFEDESFDEIHAYHVLEHLGRQGDFRFFFAQFADFWRLLKPDGLVCALVPHLSSQWAFGDPGHTRVITAPMLIYLNQEEYKKQVGVTAFADYRHVYRADFDIAWVKEPDDPSDQDRNFFFVLKAIKPSRISP